jgi:hypothetical protein
MKIKRTADFRRKRVKMKKTNIGVECENGKEGKA